MPQARVLLGLTNAADHVVEETASAVLDNLWGNANFPSPPFPSTTLQAVRDAFMGSLAAQAQGGTAATAEKNNQRAALIALLRQLASYVEDNCDNDLAKLLSSGFRAMSMNRAQSPLPVPHIKSIKTGMSGQLFVTVTVVKNPETYESRFALIGAGGTPGPWQDGGLCSNSRAIPINSLTPGQTYTVKVRAIGGSTGHSDWSDPVSHMATRAAEATPPAHPAPAIHQAARLALCGFGFCKADHVEKRSAFAGAKQCVVSSAEGAGTKAVKKVVLAKERCLDDMMRAVQDSNDPQPPQRPQIIFRIPPNVAPGPQTPFERQEPKKESGWKKALGPFAFIGVLFLKFAAPILKFFPLILKTGGSMLISIGVYAMLWGWKFAVGFILLLFVHEMGHVVAARKFGVPATAPMFIPFMGAFIALKGRIKNAYEEAEIGIAGPLWGSAGAAVCHVAGMSYNIPILVALAWSAYWLNLFNLIPVGQLDGGHVAQALSPWMWLVGFAIMVWLAITRPNFIIFMLLVMSLPRLMSLFRKRTEEEERFYEITPAQRMKMALMYFGLIGALVYQMHAADLWLAPFHKQ